LSEEEEKSTLLIKRIQNLKRGRVSMDILPQKEMWIVFKKLAVYAIILIIAILILLIFINF